MENIKKQELPISHWSYSALMAFTSNRWKFRKIYILKDYSGIKSGVSNIAGKAGHICLERYYKGDTKQQAIDAGMAFIDSQKDSDIEYGKTGSRETIIKKYISNINNYFAEELKFHKILGVELEQTEYINVSGVDLSLPIKSRSDLVTENERGEIDIWDWKFIASFTDEDEEVGSYFMQSIPNYYNVMKEFKKAPSRMNFVEIKDSSNKDNSSQIRIYTIDYQRDQEYFKLFFSLYEDCTAEISRPDVRYIPNFNDMYDGNQTFKEYKQRISGTTLEDFVIRHRTINTIGVDKAFVNASEKAQNFKTSEVDLVDNKYLSEEEKIRTKLIEFGIPVKMHETFKGSSIVLYTMKASRGVKMKSFEQYSQDLALALQAESIRILAPIMGTDLIGIEVPNKEREIMNYNESGLEEGTLKIPVGVNVYGKTVIKDLSEMPHLLVAGATGSGKSVMINVIIKSLISQNSKEKLGLILIDPKRVELAQFKNSSNLLMPTIYETSEAIKTLEWCVQEMERRYNLLEGRACRNIEEYNRDGGRMKKIVIVIDEFADLILSSKSIKGQTKGVTIDAESAIVRIAQKSRAVGMHLVLGTQRPSVDVVTGLIKANLPTRIAFRTASRVDSQIILDQAGAEQLTGKGDMLFLDPSKKEVQRLQGYYA